jgi:putative ABC transport system permease protein
MNAVLFRSLPYRAADRLAMLWTDDPRHGVHEEGVAYLNYADWKAMSSTFEDLAIVTRGNPVTFTTGSEAVRLPAELVSGNLFSLLGVSPYLGRTINADDARAQRNVVVLSYGLWKSRFGGNLDVIGHRIDIDGNRATIIGVMPKSFYFPDKETQLWQPVSIAPWWKREQTRRDSDWFRVVGRLRPSVSIGQAQAEMSSIGALLERQHHSNDPEFAGFAVNVVPLLTQVTGRYARLSFVVLLGAVGAVLLIACSNVASLLLARGAGKERELALRRAMGANRSRLIRQMLTESLLLAFAAGAIGLGVAYGGVRLLTMLAPSNLPRVDETSIDSSVLLFTLAVTISSGILFGLAPALNLSRLNFAESLKEGGRSLTLSRSGFRVQALLIVVQFALGMVLLSSAGLLLRSFISIRSADPGFVPDHVLLAKISLPRGPEKALEGPWRKILQRVGTAPGAMAVGTVTDAFLSRNPDQAITIEGGPRMSLSGVVAQLDGETASAGYFAALGVPLLLGHIYKDDDPVPSAVINDSMSRRYWPGQNPIGRRFKPGPPESKAQWITVTGVVGNIRRQGYEHEPIPEFFQPGWQDTMDLVVRTSVDPKTLATAIRNAVREVDSNVPVYDISTPANRMNEMLAPRRFETALVLVFAIMALVLATLGIYGLMHYLVAQRIGEIGVRIALGARPQDVVFSIIWRGLRTAVPGVAVGLGGAMIVGKSISALLYGVRPIDPATLGLFASILVGAGILGSLLPAIKASRIDPLSAIRHE